MTFEGKYPFHVPRIFLISPLILFLCYEAYTGGATIRILIIFVLSNIMMEMTRISNRCFYDPIHFFFFNVDFKRKFISLWLFEFFGIKFLLLPAFIGIGVTAEGSITTTILLLVFTYVLLITMQVGLAVVGNRIKLVSSVYQWALIVIFSFLIASLGIFTEGVDFLPFSAKIEVWGERHLARLAWTGTLILVSLFILSLFLAEKVYKARPFINPESFPKKMI